MPVECHLLYHLAPFEAQGRWRLCVEMLRRRLAVFGGHRLVAVATGPGLAAPAEVRAAFAGERVELLEVPNDPALREVATFAPLFELVSGLGPGHAVLWAHGKGVQSPYPEPVALWREALHYLYLDRAPDMLALLERFPVAGSFKKVGRGWHARYSRSEWHYSGSWCWFRAADLFALPDWRAIDRFHHGIESYPSLHFSAGRAGCLFWEAPLASCNLYSLPYWHNTVGPALARWKESHPMPEASKVRVELGGGAKPLPGHVNVDLGPTADVRLDLQEVCDGTANLPWLDGSVDAVYSSHCLEHVHNYKLLLWEVCRVCRVGARVELRVPHWLQSMAHCDGHRHAVSETQVRHWCRDAVSHWWQGSPKRLRLVGTERVPGESYQEARKALGALLTDEQILRFVPDACHELRFTFEVVPHA